MGDKNGFQVDMSRGIVLENGYGYEHEFLNLNPNWIPNLLVKCDKNMLKSKKKNVRHETLIA